MLVAVVNTTWSSHKTSSNELSARAERVIVLADGLVLREVHAPSPTEIVEILRKRK